MTNISYLIILDWKVSCPFFVSHCVEVHQTPNGTQYRKVGTGKTHILVWSGANEPCLSYQKLFVWSVFHQHISFKRFRTFLFWLIKLEFSCESPVATSCFSRKRPSIRSIPGATRTRMKLSESKRQNENSFYSPSREQILHIKYTRYWLLYTFRR